MTFAGWSIWPNLIYQYGVPALYSLYFEFQALEMNASNPISNSLSFNYQPYAPKTVGYFSFFVSCSTAVILVGLLIVYFLTAQAMSTAQEELRRGAYFIQKVNGISPNTYWIINYWFDFACFAVSITVMIGLCTLFDNIDIFQLSTHEESKFSATKCFESMK